MFFFVLKLGAVVSIYLYYHPLQFFEIVFWFFGFFFFFFFFVIAEFPFLVLLLFWSVYSFHVSNRGHICNLDSNFTAHFLLCVCLFFSVCLFSTNDDFLQKDLTVQSKKRAESFFRGKEKREEPKRRDEHFLGSAQSRRAF